MRTRKFFALPAAIVLSVLGITAEGGDLPRAHAAEACFVAPNGSADCYDDGTGGGNGLCDTQTPSGEPYVELDVPYVGGRFNVGRTLGANACSRTPDAVVHIQWKRDGVAIPGATTRSYTLTDADQGKALAVTVTGSKPGYVTTAKTSGLTVPIGPVQSYVDPPVPVVTLDDSNYGSMAAGHKLAAKSMFLTSGTWQSWEYSALSYSYEWARDGAPIDGATGRLYTLTTADVGHRMTVTMTGWRPEWATVSKTSAPSDVIAAGPPPVALTPADVTAPVITASVPGGDYVQGQSVRLTADETSAVFYTTDGSTPTASSPRYSKPIILSGNTTLRYIGRDLAGNTSRPEQQVYVVPVIPARDSIAPRVEATPATGSYTVGQTVALVPDEIAAIYVTTDGTRPTENSTPYTAPIRLTANTTIRYVAVDVTGNVSPVIAQTYTVSPASFIDVGKGNQFFTEIMWLAEHGVSTGWEESNGNRSYRPYQSVNRDAMAAFMYRLAGSPPYTPPAISPFVDVTPRTQFYKEITWLSERNISTGWKEPDGSKTYRPLQAVNRDAMAAFMYRFAGDKALPPPSVPYPPGYAPRGTFTDVPVDSQFFKEIEWLANNGISTGWTVDNYAVSPPTSSRVYRSLEPVNRDAMAAFMHRYNSKFGSL